MSLFRNAPAFRRPSAWLALATVLALVPSAFLPPGVDEEGYLFLAKASSEHPLGPYDWVRAWQPFHIEPPSFDFAHPPLHWMLLSGWMRLLGDAASVGLLRVLSALPFALLLGWAAGRIFEHSSRRPGLSAAVWLLSPVVFVALQAGLMIDLPATALVTAALAVWQDSRRSGTRVALASGALLGLAVATKYPMLLALPAILADMAARKAWSRGLALLAGLSAIWGGVELWLFASYGAFHVGAVLAAAGGIARSGLLSRSTGVLARLGIALVPTIFLVVRRGRAWWAAGLLPAAALLLLLRPPELSWPALAFLTLCVSSGAALVVRAVTELCTAALVGEAGKDDPNGGADLLMSAWVLAFVAGICLLHNFASARYLLPAIAPLVLLVDRWSGDLPRSRVVLGTFLPTALLGLLAALGNDLFVLSVDEVAQAVAARYPTGRFTGEWAFRWRLEQSGWTVFSSGDSTGRGTAPGVVDLAVGDVVAAPLNASPGPLPLDRLAAVEEIHANRAFPLRLADVAAHAGWYGETGGELPLWLSFAPLESARIYRVNH
jgi:hypothetical protein